MQCPMDTAASGTSPVMQFHSNADESIAHSSPLATLIQRSQRHCYGDGSPGEFPLAVSPSIVLHVLSSCDLGPKDLANLEATCVFFGKPASFAPDFALSLPELAAFDMCQKRTMFKQMKQEDQECLKQRCGGSWKHVLGYILVREKNGSRVIAGPGHSIIITSNGDVYSFGANCSGQLGLGDSEDRFKPCVIRSLQGIRITQAAVGSRCTMLVSDTGSVYSFGKEDFRVAELVDGAHFQITTPRIEESLKGVFVVQAAIGGYFSAVLSREGRVYTFSWGKAERLGHSSDPSDVEPRLLPGLEDVPVAYISAGNCYLLMLAYQPNGMSVYSVGCGLGGKLGHGCKTNNGMPKLVEQFQSMSFKPVSIAAGTWHAVALGADGRVCTWGWGHTGCLGHGDEECRAVPTVVEGLRDVKAVHVSTGEYTTFVVAENGDVYSFGSGESLAFQLDDEAEEEPDSSTPSIVSSLKDLNKKVVQISHTNASYWMNSEMGHPHTFAVMDSGDVCAFGGGVRGQLGVKLHEGVEKVRVPMNVPIGLN
ncbi:putative regulator of chromosome condensation (RCC1) family protein isoform X1 [Zea mays]|nr:putative regulator of chromosome condensation (RCC1) family protein [Zea mays]XP_008677080.1 putative regulator of chromosome condensation (RCC1) family protein isoform X1 [Zea mays]XP_008677081.1 putative regulator of chromosome condensation (RCC1) family protein isoform X1 [Zea mays]ACF85135.1 unknown [Zea mays]ACF86478.1 unknown [Zea mays]ACG32569.1 HECT domain and RCC1-like domain-containing protein 2 [Zea mays]ACL52612.1 unknown [Zea mays]ACN29033.1 unknown [Zea mays]|eukprot:NP_001145799.1 putative regulator of chromosome condensation (RCC1) family protein [Zea mays]